jgi:hypothetical protein
MLAAAGQLLLEMAGCTGARKTIETEVQWSIKYVQLVSTDF